MPDLGLRGDQRAELTMSVIRALVGRRLTSLLTSPTIRQWRRNWAGFGRRVTGREPVVHYFHQVDDPYSHLAAMQLTSLTQRYRVRLSVHLVPAPEASAAPEIDRLRDWSARDAQRLARSWGLEVPLFSRGVSPEALQAAHQVMAAELAASADPSAALPALSTRFWRGTLDASTLLNTGASAFSPGDAATVLARGQALRSRLGHYLGASFHFEGEWYWGIDRLHYLEERLLAAALAKRDVAPAPLMPPPALAWTLPPVNQGRRAVLHFYASLRSPYTALAAPQVRRLAEHYGAELRLRYVLPMVMRGLPVPLSKRLYIVRDAKREAERLGLPFGCIVDPVGEPTERGLAVLHRAVAQGSGPAFLESFLQGVFAEGMDAASEGDLLTMATRAGLSRADVSAALADDSWRAVAEANRVDMFERGIWGVPSFRIDEMPVLWGQDRLWMLEQDLIAAL